MASNLFNVSMSTWIDYVLRTMVGNPVTPVVIIIVGTILFALLVGWLWGKAWNKEWNLGGSRFMGVVVLSVVAAFSLAGINIMYGGSFDTTVASEIRGAEGLLDSEAKEDCPNSYNMLLKIQELAAVRDEEGSTGETPSKEKIVMPLNDVLINAYNNTLVVLWSIFAVAALSLIGGVAWYAYDDIKVIKPL